MLLLGLFFLFLSFYSVFSYVLTDPNLVLSSNPIYWNFQQYLWNNFYSNSELITSTFLVLIISLFIIYFLLIFRFKKYPTMIGSFFKSKYVLFYLFLLIPLLISYNALSHDIFNYVFNAKMVTVYHANPHIQVALDFQNDDLVRFMHNVHTPAPYGYGWTAFSLIPAFFGLGKFSLTLASFRLFSVFGISLLYFALQHLSKTIYKRKLYLHELALVFLNPLFLIEVVSNYHNDIWMLIPAIFSISYLLRVLQTSNSKKTYKVKLFLVATFLLVISISIKLVTVVFIPIFLLAFVLTFWLEKYAGLIKKRFNLPIPTMFISQGLLMATRYFEKYIPTVLAFLLFIPLFTNQSQQFHPWYLLWLLVWVPFIENKLIKNTILVFSLSSLLRYIPWLYNGFEFSDMILRNQKLITWVIPVLYLFTNLRKQSFKLKKINRF